MPAGRPKGSPNKISKPDLEKRIYDLENELAALRAQNSTDTKQIAALLQSLGAKTAYLALGIDPAEDDEASP